MKNKDLYKEVFSQVHTSVQINLEDYQMMRKQPVPARTFAALVAIVALMAAMTATAVAFNLFGLRDLAFPEKSTLHVPVVDEETGAVVEYDDRLVDMISMQGYADTPENQACAEWNQFYWQYTDSHTFSNGIYDEDGRYSMYSVYDDVMAEKFDEIVEKYGLKLHQSMEEVPGREAWLARFGPGFLAEGNVGYYGYAYDDGTCAFDGDAVLDGFGTVEYQFHYARKGYFDTVSLNVGDLTSYQNWDYQTRHGTAVKLALGPSRSFIWADLEEGFLFVNVLDGFLGDDTFSEGPIDRAGLEALADSFDFSALS